MIKYPNFEMFENSAMCNAELKLFWEYMKKEDKIKRVFWDEHIKTFNDFQRFVNKETWFFFGYARYKLVGGVWFHDFKNNSVKISICSFDVYEAREWEDTINHLLDWILDNKVQIVYNIIAETPYKAFTRLFKHYGFKMASKNKEIYSLVRSKK